MEQDPFVLPELAAESPGPASCKSAAELVSDAYDALPTVAALPKKHKAHIDNAIGGMSATRFM